MACIISITGIMETPTDKIEVASVYFVEIVERETEEVVKRMGPMPMRRAERVRRGADINLDHDNFFTRIIEDVT